MFKWNLSAQTVYSPFASVVQQPCKTHTYWRDRRTSARAYLSYIPTFLLRCRDITKGSFRLFLTSMQIIAYSCFIWSAIFISKISFRILQIKAENLSHSSLRSRFSVSLILVCFQFPEKADGSFRGRWAIMAWIAIGVWIRMKVLLVCSHVLLPLQFIFFNFDLFT